SRPTAVGLLAETVSKNQKRGDHMTTITLQETHVDSGRANMNSAAYAYYDRWIESLDLPICKGYYVDDLRTLDLGPWHQRGCDAAFVQLAGQEGVTGVYVTEVRPGATT